MAKLKNLDGGVLREKLQLDYILFIGNIEWKTKSLNKYVICQQEVF